MIKPAIPSNESQRLAALRRYRLLDTPAEQHFDDVTLIASQLCNTPIAVMVLVDESGNGSSQKLELVTKKPPATTRSARMPSLRQKPWS
jgi:hypothetical protein